MPSASFLLSSILGLAPADPGPAVPPTSSRDAVPEITAALDADYEPPFASETVALSDALELAAKSNLDLRSRFYDVEVSEGLVLAAIGAYDVFLTAGINGSLSETPQRGSQFAFALGSRTLAGNIGINRRLETGGTISLSLIASRTLTDQPINIFDASQGATSLSAYTIAPTLEITHPLLRGAGIKVNRADINRAKIALNQAEAAWQMAAQDAVRDLISAYWDVLSAHRSLANKRRSVSVAEQQLERTRALVAAGRLSPVDAKAVEQALATRESDVLTAEQTLLDASLTLRTLMGQQFADRDVLGVLPGTDPLVRPRNVVLKDEIERALAANPQVRSFELAIASRRIDELVAANQRLPQLDASVRFSPQGRSIDRAADASTGQPGQQGSWAEAFRNIFNEDVGRDGVLADWNLSGSLTLTWDIQNRGPRGNHQAAKAQLEQARVQLESTKQLVAASVIRSASALRTASKVIEVSELSYDLAQQNLAAEQARFEVGRATNYDVLQRLDELDAAAAQALSAQIGYLQALAQLQALNGEILPAYGLNP